MVENSKTIVLAAGGTGGHIFPAEALAGALLTNGHHPILITDTRHGGYAGTLSTLPTKTIAACTPSGRLKNKLSFPFLLILGILQAAMHLMRIRPDAVIGFGGYPSFPTMVAAILLRLPCYVHEQNAVLGRVNRVIAPFTKGIATSFPEIERVRTGDKAKQVFTGNPVRPAILATRETPYVLNEKTIHLLVTGGSQGATIFSQVVPEAIALLPKELRARLSLTQQCRKEDLERVTARYKELGVKAETAAFFTGIPARLKTAQLVIARSGASTIAELTVAGRPAILIPYLHAMDDHQSANARHLERQGAAKVLPQQKATPEALAAMLSELLQSSELLGEMAKKAASLGGTTARAAEKLAAMVAA